MKYYLKYKKELKKNNQLLEDNAILKAEIYDLRTELDFEKEKNKIEADKIEKIKALPTAKKRQLGIL